MSKMKFIAVVLGLALVATACGGDDDAVTTVATTAAPTTTTTAATTTTTTVAPTTTTTEAPLPNLIDLAISAGQFNTLLELAEIAGLDALLAQPGAFTVFAPTDDAFAALPEGFVDGLKADPEAAALLLTYHAAIGQLDSTQVAAATSIATVSTFPLTVEVDADGNVLLGGTARIIQADLIASNGVVHVIDTVLIPPGLPS